MLKIFPKVNNAARQYQHPDLTPRNVYLREGRMADMNKAQKTIDNFGKESFSERCDRVFKNIGKKNSKFFSGILKVQNKEYTKI